MAEASKRAQNNRDLPKARPRRRVPRAVLALLALQLILPLSYYLGGDKRDERFAWRMFSPVRNQRCSVQFLNGDSSRPLKLSDKFHTAWIGLAQRGRRQVIEAMATHLCQTLGGEIRVHVACERRARSGHRRRLADRSRTESDENVEVIAAGLFDFCETGAL